MNERSRCGRKASVVAARLSLAVLIVLLAAGTAQAAGRLNGDYLHVIDDSLKTKHTPWARPYAKGKIKALFVVHKEFASREVVELAQRLGMEWEAVLLIGVGGIGQAGTASKRIEGCQPDEKAAELRHKLEKDYDVIFLGLPWY